MTRRSQLFVGRLPLDSREKDIEALFERYGSLLRCDIKYGTGMAYAFVDYEDKRDAEDAIRHENGRDLRGQTIVVEWARGPASRFPMRGRSGAECYRCHRYGHWARDCPESDNDRYRGRYDNRGGNRYGRYGGRNSYSRSRSNSRGRYRQRSRTPSQVRSPSYNRSRRPKKRTPSPASSRSRSRSMDKAKARSPSKSMSRSPGPNREVGEGKGRSMSGSPRRGLRASRSVSNERKPRGSRSMSRSMSRSPPRQPRRDERSLSPDEHSKDVANGVSRGSSVDSRQSRSRSPVDD